MDLHPIFVHFPIALLSLYALLELVPFRRIRISRVFFYIKSFLVVIGFVTAFIAAQTGNLASQGIGVGPIRDLVLLHSRFAVLTEYIFGFIALLYSISLISQSPFGQKLYLSSFKKVWFSIEKIQQFFFQPIFLIPLALLGLVAITITGSLGGAIVYGPDIDPIVKMVTRLLLP